MGATAGTTGYSKAFAGSTGSNAIGDYAWYSTSSSNKTHPAGTKLPNELWLYDMSGSIWEWNWDWSGMYPNGMMTDYRGAASSTVRVRRGGSWSYDAFRATVAYRFDYFPNYQYSDVGFRIVRP